MAPMAVDEEQFKKQTTWDTSRPQGSPQGLPVKAIPHNEYPRCVYKHPIEPYQVIEHRNVHHEVVHRETVATEALVHVCQDRAEFDRKIKEGWVVEPYIAPAPPDPNEGLYGKAKASRGTAQAAPVA